MADAVHRLSSREQLVRLTEDVRFVSEEEARYRYEKVDLTRWRNRVLPEVEGEPEAINRLGQYLYESCYVRPDKGNGYGALYDPSLKARFRERLSAANACKRALAADLRLVEEREDGTLVVADLLDQPVRIAKADVRDVRDGRVTAEVPAEYPTLQAGFFHVLGRRMRAMRKGAGTVRFYFNPCREGAARLLGAVTTTFNAHDVPFRFKVLSDPQQFKRADGGVLYVPADHAADARPLVMNVHAEVRPYLRESTPLLTERLAPGLATADEPLGDGSFGTDRMRLVALGLWDAFRDTGNTAADRLERVRARLVEGRVDPDAPHLNARGDA